MECKILKLDSLCWFSQRRSRTQAYAHHACDAMLRPTVSLCLRFELCVMTQQNATFWGLLTPGGLWPLNSKSAEIFVQCTYTQVSSSYVYSFGSYHVDTQTHKHPQTHKQTRRKHPTFFATLPCWVIISDGRKRRLK